MSDSLQPHELHHTRPPCPSPTPGVHPNSCPSSRWCHPAISSSVVPFSSCPQSLPAIRVFSNESNLHMRWPKYWSFSFSIIPSKEHPGLISFRMDWLDLDYWIQISRFTYFQSVPIILKMSLIYHLLQWLAFLLLYILALKLIRNKPSLCFQNILQSSSMSSRRRQWHPTPVLLPGKSHGWRSLVGCSPWGR